MSGLELPAIASSDEIIRHDAYVICYDGERRIPEWVAYELTAEETGGDEERDGRMFSMDPDYHGTQAMREDYSYSGWKKVIWLKDSLFVDFVEKGGEAESGKQKLPLDYGRAFSDVVI